MIDHLGAILKSKNATLQKDYAISVVRLVAEEFLHCLLVSLVFQLLSSTDVIGLPLLIVLPSQVHLEVTDRAFLT